jgi:hypothetical protein
MQWCIAAVYGFGVYEFRPGSKHLQQCIDAELPHEVIHVVLGERVRNKIRFVITGVASRSANAMDYYVGQHSFAVGEAQSI